MRAYLNDFRKAMHIASMLAHQGAAEIEASLATLPPPPGLFGRAVQRRRARKVAKHMNHAAECLIAAGAAAVRTWGAFRTEFAPELSPAVRRRSSFRVVPE